jgi:hypothetical protein
LDEAKHQNGDDGIEEKRRGHGAKRRIKRVSLHEGREIVVKMLSHLRRLYVNNTSDRNVVGLIGSLHPSPLTETLCSPLNHLVSRIASKIPPRPT